MLAMDSSRQQQTSYFHNVPMDPALVDPFAFQMDNFGGFGQPSGSASAPTSYYETSPVYADSQLEAKTTGFPPMPPTPPSLPVAYSTEPYMSGLSTASGPSIASASSSAMGSPYSGTAHTFPESWVDTNHGIGLPAAVMDEFFPNEFMASSLDAENVYQRKGPDDFVDPSLIQPVHQYPNYSTPTISFPEPSGYSANCGYFPQSPDPSHLPVTESYAADHLMQTGLAVSSPLLNSTPHSRPVSIYDRRSSISSTHSRRSQLSPAASVAEFDDESKEKGRCPHPDCGRVFKDLKAHMLTHQSERPEKCPIVTCEYHVKGFARKYDKNRHTLTHYKGTMVCGFCPGSGSPAEKSFNRADVFKRHLTSVHGVEQTPPNCRKRSPAAASGKKVSDYCQDATGKCSTCSATFSNAQDFYEHLDDCVLRVVQQVEPSEVINQQRLAEVDCDEEVKKTMEKHKLLDAAGDVDRLDDEPEEDDNDYNELNLQLRSSKGAFKSNKGNASVGSRPILGSSNAVTKNSKARATVSKRRNNRDRYPPSWGCPSSSMKTKKRVLCLFDGQRRLWKDEMMLDNEFEVRLKLPGGANDGTNREAYITDLDVATLKRAEGVLSANEDERALAQKPSGTPKSDKDRSGPKPDPFENPSAELLIAQIPQENPTHALVLNKFPVIPNHFILATKAFKPQTDILEKEDLDAAYACIKAWRDSQTAQEDSGSKRLFAFFNSGDESGASQPHRHLQFLPVEAMSQGDSGSWRPLIDTVSSQSVGPDSEYRRLSQIPFAHFALPLPQNPTADTLHAIYLSLYRVALSTAKGSLGDHARATDGPAAISYNLAMTESMMMICPRRCETARIPVDPSALPDVHEPGVVALNGTILAGTLMVKAEAEWNELRRNPDTLADILAAVGYPQPDSRGLALL
ncbi:hypothetical protein CNMCM5623_001067 [Aspergillus felis]|uniref:C2H2-type domain-containing protein n=1 Tax=Aspergillus felis TaxID=1287682 RepID=A0A8H6UMC9_9EURO|nr:hypothetical protein CNMCM5623_001067 [Aspergillus felis]